MHFLAKFPISWLNFLKSKLGEKHNCQAQVQVQDPVLAPNRPKLNKIIQKGKKKAMKKCSGKKVLIVQASPQPAQDAVAADVNSVMKKSYCLNSVLDCLLYLATHAWFICGKIQQSVQYTRVLSGTISH